MAAKPDDAAAHNNYGNALNDLKRFADALDSYGRALRIKPDYAEVYYNRGNALRELRRFEDALESYARALQIKPNYAEAHCNRGLTLQALRRFEDALESYARALQIKPDYAEAYNNQGNTLRDLERFEDALVSFARALQIRPDLAEVYNNRGNVLQELERFDDALDSYERALQIKPDYAEAYYNRGNAERGLGRLDAALDSYTRALQIRPDQAEVHYHRGNVLQELERFDAALASYGRALQIKPDYAEAYNNGGNTLRKLERFEDALGSYGRALHIKPDYAEAYNNRGNVLRDLRRFEDALHSYACALQIKPDFAEVYSNRGATLQALQRFEEALDSFTAAVQVRPDFVEAYCNRGNALQELERFEDALDSFTRALEISPDCAWLLGMWLHAKMRLCDWSDIEARISELAAKIQQGRKATPPFPVLALLDCLSLQRRAAQTWVSDAHAASQLLPPLSKLRRHERIRVGYYSADYHCHATTYLMAGLFEAHDKRRFELLAFSYGPDERDDMRTRLVPEFARFLDVRTKSDAEIARISRELEIDIAVDLKGFTRNSRSGIFSCRAAPIQVSYLGYPGTTGAPYIDYLIADQTLIPQQCCRQYSEHIVYLPHSYQVNDRKRRIADKEFARAELGLPSTGFIFCCFNQHYKITPQTFDGWMRILRQVKGSVLWLLEDNETAANNLRREAQARDVDVRRLIFARRVPLPEHLARHRAADLFLDTLPCNAHTAASDALWAGLPVLTNRGESFAARVAASLLEAVGLPGLVTTTQQQYEATAIELAGNPRRLTQLKNRLQARRLTTPLFETGQFTRHLEDAYTQMYERYQASLSPDHIYVAP